MITSFDQGHSIQYIDKVWVYADNKAIAPDGRGCVRCGKQSTDKGHDACIADTPGVQSACCGHGVENGYSVQIEDNQHTKQGMEK